MPLYFPVPPPPGRFTTESLLKAKAGTELVAGTASVEELVEHADGFAEVFPEHKVKPLGAGG